MVVIYEISRRYLAIQASEWVTLLFFSLQAIITPGPVTRYLQKACWPGL